jgi:hypothetical protein
MRSSFLKDTTELSEEEQHMYNQVKTLAQKMTGVMKQMHSITRFKPSVQDMDLKIKYPLSYSRIIEKKHKNF